MIFGIIGYGRFGQLWAEALRAQGEVRVFDPNPARFPKDAPFKSEPLETIAKSDVIFLTVPISTLESVCQNLAPHLNPKAIVLDCCSVKIHPAEVMSRVFPAPQAIIATHPLFGPDSVKRSGGLRGHRIVVCPVRASDDQKREMLKLFAGMELITVEATPEQHDRQMARSQGLIHFIGRGLEALHLEPQALSTPDFQALIAMNAMVVNDAWQLFLDMHRFNPYTKEIRKSFLTQLKALDRSIGGSDDTEKA